MYGLTRLNPESADEENKLYWKCQEMPSRFQEIFGEMKFTMWKQWQSWILTVVRWSVRSKQCEQVKDLGVQRPTFKLQCCKWCSILHSYSIRQSAGRTLAHFGLLHFVVMCFYEKDYSCMVYYIIISGLEAGLPHFLKIWVPTGNVQDLRLSLEIWKMACGVSYGDDVWLVKIKSWIKFEENKLYSDFRKFWAKWM